jgi:hypothetical protein
MRSLTLAFLLLAATALTAQTPRPSPFHQPAPEDFADHSGFTSLFDGTSLSAWEGDPRFWHVANGAIIGESSKDNPVSNAYLWRKDLTVHDFDLKLEIKCEIGGGSGIQYRSQTGLPWTKPLRSFETSRNLDWFMTGPQADFWFPVDSTHEAYSGQFYSENTPLGIVSWRGQVVQAGPNHPPTLIGTFENREALGGYVRTNDWNQYEIIARGGVFLHLINGHLMTVLIDDDPHSSNNLSGKIGIELEGTPARVLVRNIYLKSLDQAPAVPATPTK